MKQRIMLSTAYLSEDSVTDAVSNVTVKEGHPLKFPLIVLALQYSGAPVPGPLTFAMLREMPGCHEGLQMLLHGITVCSGNLNHLAYR